MLVNRVSVPHTFRPTIGFGLPIGRAVRGPRRLSHPAADLNLLVGLSLSAGKASRGILIPGFVFRALVYRATQSLCHLFVAVAAVGVERWLSWDVGAH